MRSSLVLGMTKAASAFKANEERSGRKKEEFASAWQEERLEKLSSSTQAVHLGYIGYLGYLGYIGLYFASVRHVRLTCSVLL